MSGESDKPGLAAETGVECINIEHLLAVLGQPVRQVQMRIVGHNTLCPCILHHVDGARDGNDGSRGTYILPAFNVPSIPVIIGIPCSSSNAIDSSPPGRWARMACARRLAVRFSASYVSVWCPLRQRLSVGIPLYLLFKPRRDGLLDLFLTKRAKGVRRPHATLLGGRW